MFEVCIDKNAGSSGEVMLKLDRRMRDDEAEVLDLKISCAIEMVSMNFFINYLIKVEVKN